LVSVKSSALQLAQLIISKSQFLDFGFPFSSTPFSASKSRVGTKTTFEEAYQPANPNNFAGHFFLWPLSFDNFFHPNLEHFSQPCFTQIPNPELESSRLDWTLLPFAADGKLPVSLRSFSQLYFHFNPSHCTRRHSLSHSRHPIRKTLVFHPRNTVALRSFENQTDSTGTSLSIRVLLRPRDLMSLVGAGLSWVSCFSIAATSAAPTGIVPKFILGSS
jgi:hypothetical protein